MKLNKMIELIEERKDRTDDLYLEYNKSNPGDVDLEKFLQKDLRLIHKAELYFKGLSGGKLTKPQLIIANSFNPKDFIEEGFKLTDLTEEGSAKDSNLLECMQDFSDVYETYLGR